MHLFSTVRLVSTNNIVPFNNYLLPYTNNLLLFDYFLLPFTNHIYPFTNHLLPIDFCLLSFTYHLVPFIDSLASFIPFTFDLISTTNDLEVANITINYNYFLFNSNDVIDCLFQKGTKNVSICYFRQNQ